MRHNEDTLIVEEYMEKTKIHRLKWIHSNPNLTTGEVFSAYPHLLKRGMVSHSFEKIVDSIKTEVV